LNVYYTVNRVRDGLHGKPRKSDIVSVRFVLFVLSSLCLTVLAVQALLATI